VRRQANANRMHASGDDERLQNLQLRAFAYFRDECNPSNGLVVDKSAPDWPASIAATGLALTCWPVAVERNWMTREDAIARTLATLRFFRASSQGEQPDASGFHGLYYHFLDMASGRRAWQCEVSTVDTAFLLAGMLVAAAYFAGDGAAEREIRETAQFLYERADWTWACTPTGTLGHGWRPETGFIPFRWEGFDEALLLYVLALGSPAHALSPASYAAWCSTYEWKHCYDVDYLYCGPLFTHQLSHVWIDFRGIQDAFLRGKGIDYFENSRRATLVQQRYATANPLGFEGYGPHAWGITASDGPGPAVRRIRGIERRFYDYEGRGAPFGTDDGTLAPWAVVASLPFAPDVVLPTIHHLVTTLQLHDRHRYGFKATFNPTWDGDTGSPGGWVSPWHYGLNLGPIVLMIENCLSGLPWRLVRSCPPIVRGLRRAGFTGGWLDGAAAG
jgi:hypothetical protein